MWMKIKHDLSSVDGAHVLFADGNDPETSGGLMSFGSISGRRLPYVYARANLMSIVCLVGR